ncbi:MAG TPA: bile acid:sodium symporter family protein [Candidatus Thermoplasmatota archaeon]|nr:bile acid:sodium symporter family protein [Candidatus Thermoplasmatota archaeon]
MSDHGLTTNVLSDVVLPIALAVITLGMGLALTGADFRRVVKMPRAVAVGLGAQLVVLPLLAALVATIFAYTVGITRDLVLGILILACCPGGATSNLVTWLARADAALSVSLTSVTSLASALTTPFAFLLLVDLLLGESAALNVSFIDMAKLVVAIVAIPILVGMQIRKRRPAFAARIEKPLRIASVALLAVLVAGIIAANASSFWALAARSVPMSLALNALALAAGWGLARALALPPAQARAISIEVGFQNGTLGIALAVTQLGSPEAAIVPGFYSLVMFVTGGALAWWWARDAARAVPVEAPAREATVEARP